QVTPELFLQDIPTPVKKIPVRMIKSQAYQKALQNINPKMDRLLSFEDVQKKYNLSQSYRLREVIKELEIKEHEVKLKLHKTPPSLYLDFYSQIGLRYIRNKNLPLLQKDFAQGASDAGSVRFQGPETGQVFSYGLSIKDLEFDGSNNPYDQNGQLVEIGSGNGVTAIAYDKEPFKPIVHNSNRLKINYEWGNDHFTFDLFNASGKDIFNQVLNRDTKLKSTFRLNQHNLSAWNGLLSWHRASNNQPNVNGFTNNILLNTWITPPTFNLAEGTTLPNESQRRFSTSFNHPNWLLERNRNRIENQQFLASLQHEIRLFDFINVNSHVNYSSNRQKQLFGIEAGDAGFLNGFASDKNINQEQINAVVSFSLDEYWDRKTFSARSIFDFNYQTLDFRFAQIQGFLDFSELDKQDSFHNQIDRTRFRWMNKIQYDLWGSFLNVELTNNSYLSSIQKNKWLLPSLKLQLDLKELFKTYKLGNLNLYTTLSQDVNDMSLYYNNLSHNSLEFTPQQSLQLTTNNDLFIRSGLDLEQRNNLEINLAINGRLGRVYTQFSASYFYTLSQGSIFPIQTANGFSLENAANIQNQGVALNFEASIQFDNGLSWSPNLVFSTYRNRVNQLLINAEAVPIAGFSNISGNLIQGEAVGTIVGTRYARDQQDRLIIGDDGFPIVAVQSAIIGNPVPDFNLGFSSKIKWNRFDLDLIFDFQVGGDIWNGTQQVLNYFGTSQQSAQDRLISNFIFSGVDQKGNPNTRAVNFYAASMPVEHNRFTRYGFSGVGEEGIVDGSYVNLKSIDLSYQLLGRYNSSAIFGEIRVGIYGKNLVTWSQFHGYNPYSSLYGVSNGDAFNFFNMPLVSELGLNLKISL
ncbi:MAG: hypothetical protein AAF242_07135, partial [Bacteroidota bacterium]